MSQQIENPTVLYDGIGRSNNYCEQSLNLINIKATLKVKRQKRTSRLVLLFSNTKRIVFLDQTSFFSTKLIVFLDPTDRFSLPNWSFSSTKLIVFLDQTDRFSRPNLSLLMILSNDKFGQEYQ